MIIFQTRSSLHVLHKDHVQYVLLVQLSTTFFSSTKDIQDINKTRKKSKTHLLSTVFISAVLFVHSNLVGANKRAFEGTWTDMNLNWELHN